MIVRNDWFASGRNCASSRGKSSSSSKSTPNMPVISIGRMPISSLSGGTRPSSASRSGLSGGQGTFDRSRSKARSDPAGNPGTGRPDRRRDAGSPDPGIGFCPLPSCACATRRLLRRSARPNSQAVSGVSRETLARLKLFVGLLDRLECPDEPRFRQFAARGLAAPCMGFARNCCLSFREDARSLVDLGSGAGFPGLVLAVMLAERPDFRTVLYRIDAQEMPLPRRSGATELGLPSKSATPGSRTRRQNRSTWSPHAPVHRLRNCFPMRTLFQGKNTQCLFLKGQSVGAELIEANKSWTMVVEQHRSRSDPSGMILAIRELRHVTSRH